MWLACTALAGAECVSAPQLGLYQTAPSEAAAAGRTSVDALGRIVAPISINDQGPFRFIVDTGANRSALSQDLANHLGLTTEGTGDVNTLYGVSVAPLARVRAVQYQNLTLGTAPMPVLQGPVLAGEQGLLGLDGMTGRRLKLDFERRCIEITPSRGAPSLRGWIVLPGELRFGTLMVIRANIRGLRVNLLLDTGSDSTFANEALRAALNARVRHDRARLDFALAMSSGQPIVLDDAIILPSFSIGGGAIEMHDVVAYVGDFHIFQLWDLIDEPTLLIGMDVLSHTRGVAMDFQRHTVALHINDSPSTGTRVNDGGLTNLGARSYGVRH
jgi:predicted aspartyl protease